MSGMKKWEHLKIPFTEIKEATKDFQKEIGRGGYGSVYEGKLFVNGNYMKVAVKRLNEKIGQGLKEFLTEIQMLSGLQHENLITLIGYCDEENEKVLVYEFAERGSLDNYLTFRNANYTLTSLQRLKIVVDVARALDHLHNHLQENHVIIHRDIKSSNILLDHNWVAKISDLGLSKLAFSDLGRSSIISQAAGTMGYVEPEYIHNGIVTKMSDVYSFGMVLFEVLCGRLCYVIDIDGILLSAEVAKEYYEKNKLDPIIDPVLRKQMSADSLRKFSAVAYKCFLDRKDRPSIDLVKKELEEILKMQISDSSPTHNIPEMKLNLRISFKEIKEATHDFKNIIGKGGYGFVYEGELYFHGTYTKVAVKRSNEEFGQGVKEFLTEIQLLSGQEHENVITLVGYCDEGKEKITIYKFAENRSLDRYIRCSNTSHTLTWLERLKIVVDAAHGLDHLHNHLGEHQYIIHRDIKSANILLDHKWVAKISDLGFSKLTYSAFGFISKVCGTEGYFEPEYYQTGSVTKRTDVYSFGMVLFEVLCGRLCYVREKDGILLTAEVAKEHYAEGKLDKIIDPILWEQMSPDSLSRYSAIAYKCLQVREQRPLMEVVKKELQETLKTAAFLPTPTHSISGMKEWNVWKIPFNVIKDATKDFRTPIGKGAHGSVYEGELSVHGIYMKVAIKRLNYEFSQLLKEFTTELQLHGSKQHENIVTLVGNCDEGNEKIIVYEYADHGSLDRYIRCNNTTYTLTWLERLKIVVDAARGLDRLHNHPPENQVIIHGHIKSSNILLDHRWVAKISDLGLSKLTFYGFDRSTTKSGFGRKQPYVEPEYIQTGLVTKKSDVYSFGMVLFEVLCGRLCTKRDDDGILLSPKVAKEYYASHNLDMIIDPILREQMSSNSLKTFSTVAYKCMQARAKRPLMNVIKKELEEVLNNEVLRIRSSISRHWYILNGDDLPLATDIIMMQHKETNRLKCLSISSKEDTTEEEDRKKKAVKSSLEFIKVTGFSCVESRRRSTLPITYMLGDEFDKNV